MRQDLFAADVIRELQALQDRVPPFPADEARGIIEAELGSPLPELFAQFEGVPLAAASIAQVHRARLSDGTAVIYELVGLSANVFVTDTLYVLFAGKVRMVRAALAAASPEKTAVFRRRLIR